MGSIDHISVDSTDHTHVLDLKGLSSSAKSNGIRKPQIIDIRHDKTESSLKTEIFKNIHVAPGQEMRLPTLLLYDEEGLKLFEKITYLEEYYLTNAEIKVLEEHADHIARTLDGCSILVELGSGNLRKIDILLRAFDRLGKPIQYFALDLDLKELQRTLSLISSDAYQNVTCYGLHGTYDDGLVFLQQATVADKRKAVFSLGSSLGNFDRAAGAAFVRDFLQVLGPSDFMILGLDACKDPERVYRAYNDREGVTHQFVLNGLGHANRILGYNAFDVANWHVIGEFDVTAGRHHAFVTPTTDTTIDGVLVKAGERIRIEESYKFDVHDRAVLWQAAGASHIGQVRCENEDYAIHMLTKQPFQYDLGSKEHAAAPVPTLAEWAELWALWDVVSRHMIPGDELLSKPIKLRNACIFYLGHIPTFLDIKLAESTDGLNTDPKYFTQIFERGIDPDVDNPEHCHKHSEIPDSWPSVDDIMAYQRRVRDRVKKLYESGAHREPWTGRTLWLGYEHEAMHLETLLYMLIQSDKTLPPAGVTCPDFKVEAEVAAKARVTNQWFEVPSQEIEIGIEDPELPKGPERHFGWDVEKPVRKAHVPAFHAKARPISNSEYAEFLRSTGSDKLPASWIQQTAELESFANGSLETDALLKGKSIRTVWGLVPLVFAKDWPVAASYDELSACAQWMGGRIPTFEETRSIYNFVEQRKLEANQKHGEEIPAVNAHLTNLGVEETPPAASNGQDAHGSGSSPGSVFYDLKGANVGFQNWNPKPVTQNGHQLCGQGEFGGLWEWTSSPLRSFEGYEPMKLYPAYSSDFFDEKHNIVLGGSWATVPRIAGRKSFVNWYQRNYPYVWAGARLVKDA